ncbi:MAG: hypothetical protein V4725_14370 [Bacteroidota bacterium]
MRRRAGIWGLNSWLAIDQLQVVANGQEQSAAFSKLHWLRLVDDLFIDALPTVKGKYTSSAMDASYKGRMNKRVFARKYVLP